MESAVQSEAAIQLQRWTGQAKSYILRSGGTDESLCGIVQNCVTVNNESVNIS